jgi:very-short-patch-repair endonuclease/DNA-binding transcriptional MerR regulator
MAMSMTAPIRLAVAERRRLAVELRKQGGTLEEIAEQLRGVEGVSPKYGKDQVQKDIKAELGRLQAQTSEIAEELRQLEVERLDDLWKVYFAKAKKGDYAAADRCFVILDKRAKLMPSLYPPAPPSTLRLTGAGESAKQAANRLGVCRQVIARILSEHGVQARGRSAAELVKWRRMSAEARTRQVSAAHAAARGRVADDSERERRAVASEGGKVVGRFEVELRELFGARGLPMHGQTRVGPYHLDLANEALRFAVEVIANSPNRHRIRAFRERTEYLLGLGWRILFVSMRTGRARIDPGLEGIADEGVAYAKLPRGKDATRGDYRVVRRHGQPTTLLSRHLDGVA